MTSRIPITIISGYLGAGKTTLINQLLTGSHGRRIAVLVNDFGSVNVDSALIESEGEDAISLANGCVCCSITDDLGTALQEQADRHMPPELIVLEASGVADPVRIACHAGNWPGFELDAVITLVDVETVATRISDKFVGQLVKSQIKAGNLIVLTKTDLISEDDLILVSDVIKKISPDTRLLDASHGLMDPLVLIGQHSVNESNRYNQDPEPVAQISTAYWQPSMPITALEMERRLDRLPETIHRVKGFFTDADAGLTMLVQKVGARCKITQSDEKNVSGLVLIGVGGAAELQAAVASLSVPSLNVRN